MVQAEVSFGLPSTAAARPGVVRLPFPLRLRPVLDAGTSAPCGTWAGGFAAVPGTQPSKVRTVW